ncbi:hypothetical protein EVA_13442, partial [gut metagenome]
DPERLSWDTRSTVRSHSVLMLHSKTYD